ncbi:MAG TPA: hypothetical protein VFA18_19875 [Gemmataceae bacterium]|nr:hypothetical protein [Gemmataceae bacterium]
MNDQALQNRATEIIKPLVPPDAEERVNRSLKQWNQIVRDHIRTETGLKLSDGDSRFAIPVRVVRGFPVTLAQLIDQYSDPVMWRLIIGQPKLGGLVQGLEFLLRGWEQFEKWPSLPETARNNRSVLDRALSIATSLQQVALADQVVQQIKQIHEDILGVYRFQPGQGSAVALYWLPVAMVAAMLDVSIEDLTVVVLIHELAHGYTHIGREIDGASWSDIGFGESELDVTEGLAQFYTEVISQRLSVRTPSLFRAYESLLSLQSGPYLAHREWLKGDRKQIGETVRFTLIAARSQGRVLYDHWRALMAETGRNLVSDRELA